MFIIFVLPHEDINILFCEIKILINSFALSRFLNLFGPNCKIIFFLMQEENFLRAVIFYPTIKLICF